MNPDRFPEAATEVEVCAKGETQQCFCGPGTLGVQGCLEDRTGWRDCNCDSGGAPGEGEGEGGLYCPEWSPPNSVWLLMADGELRGYDTTPIADDEPAGDPFAVVFEVGLRQVAVRPPGRELIGVVAEGVDLVSGRLIDYDPNTDGVQGISLGAGAVPRVLELSPDGGDRLGAARPPGHPPHRGDRPRSQGAG